MRIFIAIKASDLLQKRVLEWQTRQNLDIRWILPENLHVTLLPPWQSDDLLEIKQTSDKLKHIKIPKFEINFNLITYGPNLQAPRLIWAGGEVNETIESLRLAVDRIIGRKFKERPFRLHMTLARFSSQHLPTVPLKPLEEKVLWKESVTSFVLMQSHLSGTGAEYEVLEEFPLT